MTLKFKQATLEDWEKVRELEEASATHMFAPCEDEEGYKRYVRESTVYFILNEEDEAIGTISYKDQDDTVTIKGLTVNPEYRGKGIAKTAMKQLMEEIGNRKMALTVHPANTPALMIYLRLGFTIVAWKDDYFGDGEPRLYLKY
jgi:ribosomal protein S18 acetylase RimI-like enzyme